MSNGEICYFLTRKAYKKDFTSYWIEVIIIQNFSNAIAVINCATITNRDKWIKLLSWSSPRARRKEVVSVRKSAQAAIRAIRAEGGIVRTKDALDLGIAPRTLYWMRDNGILETVSRGLYRLADQSPLSNQDLTTVAARIPNGVVCLISALAYHNMTAEIPWTVDVALPRGAKVPRLRHPPVRFIWRSGAAFQQGVHLSVQPREQVLS